jgi:hypothetical protein
VWNRIGNPFHVTMPGVPVQQKAARMPATTAGIRAAFLYAKGQVRIRDAHTRVLQHLKKTRMNVPGGATGIHFRRRASQAC